LTASGRSSPLASSRPLPTASTSPWSGFSPALSGMTMPLAVVRSLGALDDDPVVERTNCHFSFSIA
jgi:hypothetical protein